MYIQIDMMHVVSMYNEWSSFYDLLGSLMLVLDHRNWATTIFIFHDPIVKLQIHQSTPLIPYPSMKHPDHPCPVPVILQYPPLPVFRWDDPITDTKDNYSSTFLSINYKKKSQSFKCCVDNWKRFWRHTYVKLSLLHRILTMSPHTPPSITRSPFFSLNST